MYKRKEYKALLGILLLTIVGFIGVDFNILGIVFSLIYLIGYPVYFILKSKGAPRVKGLIIDEENSWFPGMRQLLIQFYYEGNEHTIKHDSNAESAQKVGQSVTVVVIKKNLGKSYVESSGSYVISIVSGILMLVVCIYRMTSS